MAKKDLPTELKEKFRPTDAIDQEVDALLADTALESIYQAEPSSRPAPAGGAPGDKSVRTGRVVSIGKEDLFVDFGGKSQGVCSLIQFLDAPEPKVGDEIEFVVDRYDADEGLLILSRKGAATANVSWENIAVGTVVEATVTGVNKGGLELEVKGMRAFMPAGQVELYHVPDFKDYIGKRVTAEVTRADASTRNLVLSRRNLLEREKEEKKQQLMAELGEGQVRRGVVRSVMDYGAFVDLGGAEGLLHVSELSFRRGVKAGDVVKIGDVVDVKIIKLDREAGKMSLSLKQARGTDPWADADARYAVGTAVTGRVTKVESFGCFIEVEEGVEGLLPVSEMSYQRIKHPSDMLKEGDTAKLVVLSVDPMQRRMSFSLKQAGPDPWKTVNDRYHTNGNYEATVTRVVDFGAFAELETGLEGLIHVSEMSNQRIKSPGDVVKPGQSVKVRIIDIDADARRIGLSLRRVNEAMPEPADAAPATPAAPKKPKLNLKGGLDFDYKKNK